MPADRTPSTEPRRPGLRARPPPPHTSRQRLPPPCTSRQRLPYPSPVWLAPSPVCRAGVASAVNPTARPRLRNHALPGPSSPVFNRVRPAVAGNPAAHSTTARSPVLTGGGCTTSVMGGPASGHCRTAEYPNLRQRLDRLAPTLICLWVSSAAQGGVALVQAVLAIRPEPPHRSILSLRSAAAGRRLAHPPDQRVRQTAHTTGRFVDPLSFAPQRKYYTRRAELTPAMPVLPGTMRALPVRSRSRRAERVMLLRANGTTVAQRKPDAPAAAGPTAARTRRKTQWAQAKTERRRSRIAQPA